jgi:hypothetical protein
MRQPGYVILSVAPQRAHVAAKKAKASKKASLAKNPVSARARTAFRGFLSGTVGKKMALAVTSRRVTR